MDPQHPDHAHRKGDGHVETLDDLKSLPECRRRALVVCEPDGRTVYVMPLRCKSWRCDYCGPRIRRVVAARLAAAGCRRFITLTCDPRRFACPQEAFMEMKRALPRLIRRIRRRFGECEYAAVWEWTQAGWPHIHILQRGAFVPQKWLSSAWHRLGIGRVVHIQQVSTDRGAARYVTKYLAKGAYSSWMIPKGYRWIQISRNLLPPVPRREGKINRPEYRVILVWEGAGRVVEHLALTHGYQIQPGSDYSLIRMDRPGPAEQGYMVQVLVDELSEIYGARLLETKETQEPILTSEGTTRHGHL